MTTSLRSSKAADAGHHAALSLVNPGYEIRRVGDGEDWRQARALRYDALRHRDDIGEHGDGAFGDRHDEALNTATFLLLRNGRAVGSTRSSVSSARRRWPLPSTEVFAAEIEAAAGPEATIVEASLTVVDPAVPGDPKTALFHLLKAHMVHCATENADWLVVAVRDSQIGFYRRMFNMEILSGAEGWPGLASPRVLMGLDFPRYAALLFKRIPVLAVSGEDEREFAESGTVRFAAERRPGAPARRDASMPRLLVGD